LKYAKGKEIIWFGCTSTTTNMETITNFLGNQEGTIFCINGCLSGRAIHNVSSVPSELEVIVPPGSRFEIKSIMVMGNITLIQLKQIPSFETLLKFE